MVTCIYNFRVQSVKQKVGKDVTNLCPYLYCTLYRKKQKLVQDFTDRASNVIVRSTYFFLSNVKYVGGTYTEEPLELLNSPPCQHPPHLEMYFLGPRPKPCTQALSGGAWVHSGVGAIYVMIHVIYSDHTLFSFENYHVIFARACMCFSNGFWKKKSSKKR